MITFLTISVYCNSNTTNHRFAIQIYHRLGGGCNIPHPDISSQNVTTQDIRLSEDPPDQKWPNQGPAQAPNGMPTAQQRGPPSNSTPTRGCPQGDVGSKVSRACLGPRGDPPQCRLNPQPQSPADQRPA